MTAGYSFFWGFPSPPFFLKTYSCATHIISLSSFFWQNYSLSPEEERFSMYISNMLNLYQSVIYSLVMPCIKSQNVKFIYRVKIISFLIWRTTCFLTMIRVTSQEENLHLVFPLVCFSRLRRMHPHWHVL